MACKKALTKSNGDMEKAFEILRKTGEAKAASKSERTTSEGGIFIKISNNKICIVKILCETDFVSRNEDFIKIGNNLAEMGLEKGEDKTNEEADSVIKNAVLKLGENIKFDSIKVLEKDTWGYYIHSNGKLGAIVSLSGGNEEQAKDIAMHVTASSPDCILPEEVSSEFIEKEVDIMKEQLKNEGKPEQIWDKILEGKIKKLKEEKALITQNFVKDPSIKVKDFLKEATITYFEKIEI